MDGLGASLVRRCRPRERRLGAGVPRGQEEGEGAALAGRAHHVDRAAEQARDLAADRQPEPGAAVLPARRAVGLLERLEDRAAASRAGCRSPCRAPRRRGRPLRARAARAGSVSVTPPVDGELERVRQQVLEDLLQAVDVAEERLRQLLAHSDLEGQALLGRHVPERLLEVVAHLREREDVRVDRHLARLHLREVEDLVDELQEIVARREDGLRELHLLGGQVPVAVVRQHLREDEQAVERRPQLVGHVREELALVLGDELELLGLLLEAAARELDLAVLDLEQLAPCR